MSTLTDIAAVDSYLRANFNAVYAAARTGDQLAMAVRKAIANRVAVKMVGGKVDVKDAELLDAVNAYLAGSAEKQTSAIQEIL
jgi:hypothetical protein